MKCFFCYNNHVHALNPNTKERNGFITYYKTYGITILKKHVDSFHAMIIKKIEEKVNVFIRGSFEKQLVKNKMNVLGNVISKFFLSKIL